MTPAHPRRVGAYAKLLANYANDDAIIDAGQSAELLFVRGLAFCATSDSDGYITEAQVQRYVGAGMRDAKKRADTLVRVGLWIRLDGGYLVRSWTKLHDTAADKGRKLKADRERKSTAKKPQPDTDSDRNPDGIQTEGVNHSAGFPVLIHDRTGQRHDNNRNTTSDTALSGQRYETLEPADARCSSHKGVTDPGPCRGCKTAREAVERKAARESRAAAERAERCPDCHGTNWLEDDAGNPTRKCDHRRSA